MSWLLLITSIECTHRRPKTLSQKNLNPQNLSNLRKCVLHYCKPWHFFGYGSKIAAVLLSFCETEKNKITEHCKFRNRSLLRRLSVFHRKGLRMYPEMIGAGEKKLLRGNTLRSPIGKETFQKIEF